MTETATPRPAVRALSPWQAISPEAKARRKRWFLEPPHMQSSQLFLPKGVTPPGRGDEVPVELRLTTATVDRIAEI